MKGTIDIKSEPDQGTEFHLTFDFEKADAVEMDMDMDMALPPLEYAGG